MCSIGPASGSNSARSGARTRRARPPAKSSRRTAPARIAGGAERRQAADGRDDHPGSAPAGGVSPGPADARHVLFPRALSPGSVTPWGATFTPARDRPALYRDDPEDRHGRSGRHLLARTRPLPSEHRQRRGVDRRLQRPFASDDGRVRCRAWRPRSPFRRWRGVYTARRCLTSAEARTGSESLVGARPESRPGARLAALDTLLYVYSNTRRCPC